MESANRTKRIGRDLIHLSFLKSKELQRFALKYLRSTTSILMSILSQKAKLRFLPTSEEDIN
jgi:hypothetical protein